MENEIEDKLEEIYNNQILIEVETEIEKNINRSINRKKYIFKVHGSIKSYKLNIIRKGFIIYFEYDRTMTMDFNINNLVKEIDKNIIKLYKEEK